MEQKQRLGKEADVDRMFECSERRHVLGAQERVCTGNFHFPKWEINWQCLKLQSQGIATCVRNKKVNTKRNSFKKSWKWETEVE